MGGCGFSIGGACGWGAGWFLYLSVFSFFCEVPGEGIPSAVSYCVEGSRKNDRTFW